MHIKKILIQGGGDTVAKALWGGSCYEKRMVWGCYPEHPLRYRVFPVLSSCSLVRIFLKKKFLNVVY